MVSTDRKFIMRASSVLVLAVLLAGCSQVRSRQGYLPDQQLIAAVQPGVDNRESVQRTLGRPSFIGQFDANDWYYVGRETKQLAFALPRPTQQTLLHVRFDQTGNVIAVQDLGLTKVAQIRPESDKTPTLGRNRSFFEDLFGNIGQIGAAGASAPTQDNPDG